MSKKEIVQILFLLSIFCCLPATKLWAAYGRTDKFTLVIDAGHGGKDPGAQGSFSKEKNINLSVAREFGRLVERYCSDVRVIYTRKTDVFVTLSGRADIANKAKADLFVSIHTNAMERSVSTYGAETYTLGMARAKENLAVAKRENSVILKEDNYKERYQGFDPRLSESYIIFEVMQDKYMAQSVDLAKLIQKQFRNTAGRQDKGVHQAGFAVLRLSSMPSVLVELGYISTPAEERFLNSDSGVAKMARSIFNAFVQYKQQQALAASQVPTNVPQDDYAYQNDTPEVRQTNVPPPQNRIPSQPSGTAPTSLPQQPNGNTLASLPQPSTAGQVTAGRPVFKIQVLTYSSLLDVGCPQFKGLAITTCFQEDGMYKYTFGATTNYNEIYQTWKSVVERFPDAFIIAFRDGVKMDVVQALREFRQNR